MLNTNQKRHRQLSLNHEGRWGTTDDFATSFLHSFLFSTSLWPVHSLMLSPHLFLCLPCLLPPFTVPCKIVLARPDEWETWPYNCSLCLFTLVRRSGWSTFTQSLKHSQWPGGRSVVFLVQSSLNPWNTLCWPGSRFAVFVILPWPLKHTGLTWK